MLLEEGLILSPLDFDQIYKILRRNIQPQG